MNSNEKISLSISELMLMKALSESTGVGWPKVQLLHNIWQSSTIAKCYGFLALNLNRKPQYRSRDFRLELRFVSTVCGPGSMSFESFVRVTLEILAIVHDSELELKFLIMNSSLTFSFVFLRKNIEIKILFTCRNISNTHKMKKKCEKSYSRKVYFLQIWNLF